jgi:pimeloyl-ACP methyl ester carboxylesterase
MNLPPGVISQHVQTTRLNTHILTHGPTQGEPIFLLHGNVSSSHFFVDTLVGLPARYFGIAPDLRGYGDSETKPLDATRGVRDFADDLHSLIQALDLAQRPAHLVGWSLAAGILMQYALDHPATVASLTLISPVSPYGFGGTKDLQGTQTAPDGAGSGGGTANPEFVKRVAAKDASSDGDLAPRNVMNAFYFKPPFRVPIAVEDWFVASMNSTVVGEDNYPGDLRPSPHWPGIAPGTRGVLNAISPVYFNLSHFAELTPQPPVLWIRGANDQIVADGSLFDLAMLGQLGVVPGWPGADVCPPQPMVSQMRAVLDRYQANGGRYQEVVFADCGHSPHIERPEEFQRYLLAFLAGVAS